MQYRQLGVVFDSVVLYYLQTPKIGDVPLGGIGSSVNFTEDSTLGPEPLIWNSPNRYGNGVDNKVPLMQPKIFLL